MLTLGRESGQYIVIGGNIIVQVVEVGNQLRLAIDAPRELSIERGENYEKNHPAPSCIARLRAKQEKPKPFDFSRSSVKAPAEERKK